MSTAYQQHTFADQAAAPSHFAQQFDLQNPDAAMESYQKVMHEHTKQQFDVATASLRRRSNATEPTTLSPATTRGSVDSNASTAS